MKKERIYKILFTISVLLLIAFFILIILDYSKYDSLVSSAPFSSYVLARTLEFIIPSIVLLGIALLLKHKRKVDKDE